MRRCCADSAASGRSSAPCLLPPYGTAPGEGQVGVSACASLCPRPDSPPQIADRCHAVMRCCCCGVPVRAQTAELQVLRQRLKALEAVPADHPVGSEPDDATPSTASSSPSSSASAAVGRGCLPGPAAPYTLKDLEARIAEVRIAIELCVSTINEALEELREEEQT